MIEGTAMLTGCSVRVRKDCRKCQEQGAGEIIEHLLCTCAPLASLRFKQLGIPRYETLEEVWLGAT